MPERQYSQRETLMRVLKCSNDKAKAILAGERAMSVHEWHLVKEFNKGCNSPEFEITIKSKVPESPIVEELTDELRERALKLANWAQDLESGLDFSIYLHMKVLGMSNDELLKRFNERVEFIRSKIVEGA